MEEITFIQLILYMFHASVSPNHCYNIFEFSFSKLWIILQVKKINEIAIKTLLRYLVIRFLTSLRFVWDNIKHSWQCLVTTFSSTLKLIKNTQLHVVFSTLLALGLWSNIVSHVWLLLHEIELTLFSLNAHALFIL